MDSTRAERLATAIGAIQKQWGNQAIAPLRDFSASQAQAKLSTGLREVDTLLEGGLLQGQMTLITGMPGSGRATFTLSVLAHAQRNQHRTTYLDFASTFDAEQGRQCGVALDELLLVRPQTTEDGLEIASELIARYGVGLLVLDQTFEARTHIGSLTAVSAAIRRLASVVRRSTCTVLCLPPLHVGAAHLQSQVAVTLRMERTQWLRQWGDVYGLEAQMTVTKHKSGKLGQRTTFRIELDQTGRPGR